MRNGRAQRGALRTGCVSRGTAIGVISARPTTPGAEPLFAAMIWVWGKEPTTGRADTLQGIEAGNDEQAGGVGVIHIVGSSAVFQVADLVVCLIAVLVVYVMSVWARTDECGRHQSMDRVVGSAIGYT